MKEKMFTCDCCGNELPLEELEIDNETLHLCRLCYESEYFRCESCGRLEHVDYSNYVSDRQIYVCSDCANYDYVICEDCGELVEEHYYIEHYGNVCERCYDDRYFYCESCGNYYHEDNLGGSDGYERYCIDCYAEQSSNSLLGYHTFSDWKEYYATGEEKAPFLIGIESELEPKGNVNQSRVIEIMNNYLNAVAMEDGSLSYGGVEIVTHPQSWKYLKEHKKQYENFYNEIVELGYGNGGHSGLHFHITKPNENVISRIIILMESFKSEIKKLSRRKDHQLSEWSKFLTDYSSTYPIKYQSSKYLKEKFLHAYHDRYMALNLSNSKTIEFRFFNGVNNFEEFWASLQFIHNIMQIAINEEVDVNKVKWDFLIYGDELIAQAIKTKTYLVEKYAKDTTEIYEKLLAIEDSTKQDIKKVMNNFIKYVNRELNNIEINNQFTNYSLLIDNTTNFSNEITRTCNYLNQITRIAQSIDERNITDIKFSLEFAGNREKYKRYFKKLEKLISNFESEVRLQCV